MIGLLMGWFIFWIGGWLFFSVLVAVFASSKNRSGIGWFFLSLLISPLIAFIIVLVAGPPSSSLKKCPKCAENVKVEAQICRFCNYEFPSLRHETNSLEESVSELKKVNILLMIILTVITLGIYYPVWFLIRRKAINKLQSIKKIKLSPFVYTIVLFSIIGLFNLSFLFVIIRHALTGVRQMWSFLPLLFIMFWVAEIILIFQCFKIRRILDEHFNAHLQKGISISGVATFFFQLFYIQHKINTFVEILESTDKEKGENKRFQEGGGIEIRKGEEKQTKEKVTPNFANREEYEKWKEGRKITGNG